MSAGPHVVAAFTEAVAGLPRDLFLAAAIPIAIVAGIWAAAQPHRFVLFVVLPTQIFPAALFTGGGTEIAAADLLLLAGLAGWLVAAAANAAPGPWIKGNPYLAAGLLYTAVNAISLAWSENPRETIVQMVQVLQIVVVVPLVFASLPRSLKDMRTAFLIFIGLTCVMAVITFALWLPRALAGDLEGQYLPGQNKNTIGSYVGAGLVLAYGLWLGESRRRVRMLLILAVGIETVGLFASVSRGAIIGAVLGVLLMSFVSGHRRLFTVGAVAVAAVFFLTVVGYESGVDRSLSGSYDSSLVRSYSFANAVEKIEERPVFGVGAGAYFDYIPQIPITLPDPNNMFLLTWAELGLLGMGSLLFLLWRYGQIWIRGGRLMGEAAALSTAAGGVALSFFVHFQFDVTWTRGTTTLAFVMIGAMLAVSRLTLAKQERKVASGTGPRHFIDRRPAALAER